MMKFTWEDKDWRIDFEKMWDDIQTRNGDFVLVPCGMTATITNVEDEDENFSGFSYCNLDLDTFDPEVGRKMSLKRAIETMMGDNREGRRVAWNAYLTREKKKPYLYYRVVTA